MYFTEDVVKYSYIDELKYMISYYSSTKEKFEEYEFLWKRGLDECQYLLVSIQNCMFTHEDMLNVKKYATIARELRCGLLNKNIGVIKY